MRKCPKEGLLSDGNAVIGSQAGKDWAVAKSAVEELVLHSGEMLVIHSAGGTARALAAISGPGVVVVAVLPPRDPSCLFCSVAAGLIPRAHRLLCCYTVDVTGLAICFFGASVIPRGAFTLTPESFLSCKNSIIVETRSA